MEVTDERDRVRRLSERPPDQRGTLDRIREIAPRPAADLMLQPAQGADGIRPIWDLEDRQSMAIPRNLIVVSTRMVWLLRGSAPIVVAEWMAGAGDGPAMGHAGKRREVDLHAQLRERPHRLVVMIRPARLRRLNRKSSGQRGEAFLQALSDPVLVRVLLVPEVLRFRVPPSVRMPPDLVTGFPPTTPEIRELVSNVCRIPVFRRRLFIRP